MRGALLENIGITSSHGGPGIGLSYHFSRFLCEPAFQPLIAKEFLKGSRQVFRIAGAKQQTRCPVSYRFRESTGFRSNDRRAAEHRFEQDEGEPLVSRGHDEDIGMAQIRLDVALESDEQDSLGEPKIGDSPGQRFPLRSVANYDQVKILYYRRDLAERLYCNVESLYRLQSSHADGNSSSWRIFRWSRRGMERHVNTVRNVFGVEATIYGPGTVLNVAADKHDIRPELSCSTYFQPAIHPGFPAGQREKSIRLNEPVFGLDNRWSGCAAGKIKVNGCNITVDVYDLNTASIKQVTQLADRVAINARPAFEDRNIDVHFAKPVCKQPLIKQDDQNRDGAE